MYLEPGMFLGPEDRNGITQRRMNPNNIRRRTERCPSHYDLSLNYLDPKTANHQEALLLFVSIFWDNMVLHTGSYLALLKPQFHDTITS